MSQTSFQHSTEEIAEIEKHKYFLSEKAGHDVGWEAAEQDWEANYAQQYRQTKEKASGESGTFLSRLLAKARAR